MSIFDLRINAWKAVLVIITLQLINMYIHKFNWSPVKKGKKPIGWWYHKVMCEIGWAIRKYQTSQTMYYKHLNKMCDKYNINLYGEILRSDITDNSSLVDKVRHHINKGYFKFAKEQINKLDKDIIGTTYDNNKTK